MYRIEEVVGIMTGGGFWDWKEEENEEEEEQQAGQLKQENLSKPVSALGNPKGQRRRWRGVKCQPERRSRKRKENDYTGKKAVALKWR